MNKLPLFLRSFKEVFFACTSYNTFMAVCLFIIGLMPALNVYATSQLVSLFENKNAHYSITLVLFIWGASMLLPALLAPLVSFLQSHIDQLVTHKIMTRIMSKNASFKGLMAYDNVDIQDASSVLKTQSKFRPINFSFNIVTIIRETVTVLALSLMLFSVKWWVPFAVLLSAIPLAHINFRVASFSWQALMHTGKESRFMDYFSSISFSREAQKDIHLFGANALISDKYNEAFNKVYEALKKSQLKIFIKPIPFQVISVVITGLVLFFLYQQSKDSIITASSTVILLQSIFILNNRMEGLIQHGSLLYEILDYFEKYFSFLDSSVDIKNGHLTIQQIETIQFDNVGFKYPNTNQYILNDISFTASIGESIAIVGHNGAGKSTLVHLICRFWDVTEGKILVNGHDIRLYDVENLRKSIGAVFQDFFRFNFTINENITFSNSKTTNQDRIRAELQLPTEQSLDTFIGKSFGGIELSGGQWQKLAILRCLNSNSSMIILDEPTSAIDPKAEAALYDDFKQLSVDKLSFMITHRLGSVKDVSRILVLDKGRLGQDGSPETLKNVEGVFKELWKIQSDMYT